METSHIVGHGGAVLLRRLWNGGTGAPVAFVGHSQPTHSGNLTDLCAALHRGGWSVHSGDLRGHGASVGATQPRAHLDPHRGWQDLIADARQMIGDAFAATPWENRLVVAPNITALLVLELLKEDPMLARHIVLISPPPNQPVLATFAQAFIKARMLFCRPDEPDEHTLHHVYTFLGAQLPNRGHLHDVISPDTDRLDRLADEDPAFFPTPTPGYWSTILGGMSHAWAWPKVRRIDPRTRINLMYGGEDPIMGHGAFVRPLAEWLEARGAGEVSATRVEGARSGVYLEERRLGIAARILDWVARPGKRRQIPDETISVAQISEKVLARLGRIADGDGLAAEPLIDLCYRAIEDDVCWAEILHRLTLNMSGEAAFDDPTAERLIAALMPHWDRAYRLTQHVNREAAIGAMLQAVVDRLDIGMAIVTRDMRILHANEAFDDALEALDGTRPALRRWLPDGFRAQVDGGAREALLVIAERPHGYFFRPPRLARGERNAALPHGILVLRHRGRGRTDRTDSQIGLLELAYGMTRQEAAVAIEITHGHSPDAIAARLGLSIHTVRTHLKRGYEKMGVQGQTDLVSRLMHGPVGWLAPARARHDAAASARPRGAQAGRRPS